MICRGWTIVAAALLIGACAEDAPPVPAETGEARNDPAPQAEVAGEERRILAFGDSLFAGYGLATDEGYPEKLEAALRARGINARVADAGVSGDTTAGGRQRIDGPRVEKSASAPPRSISRARTARSASTWARIADQCGARAVWK